MQMKIVQVKFVIKLSSILSLLLFCSVSSVDGKLSVIAFPSQSSAGIQERVSVYVQVMNNGKTPVTLPGGKRGEHGRIHLYEYETSATLYKVEKGKYIKVESWGNSNVVEGIDESVTLGPGESLVYQVDCVPFEKGSEADYCYVKINVFGFGGKNKPQGAKIVGVMFLKSAK